MGKRVRKRNTKKPSKQNWDVRGQEEGESLRNGGGGGGGVIAPILATNTKICPFLV